MQARAKNYLILLLACATATAASIAWRQTQRFNQLQSSLSAGNAASARKVAVARAGTYSTPAAAKASSSDEDAATDDPAAQQNNNGRQRRNGRANFEALLANPKFAKAWNVEQTARINQRYGALFKQLNLSPEQQAALANLLMERQNSARDVMTAARDQGLNPGQNRDEIRQMVAQAQAQVDQSIQSALGAAGYQQYQNYESTQTQRNVVSELNQTLGASSMPLTSAQSAFLVQALSGSGASAGGGGPGGFGPQQATITDAVIAQAQNVLSPDQVNALRQLQAQQQAQQTMRQMFQAQARAGNNGN